MPPLPISPATVRALRTLVGRALDRIVRSGDVRELRRLRDDATTLTVTAEDGRLLSGVLVIHESRVVSGFVVPSATPEEELKNPRALSENTPSMLETVRAYCEREHSQNATSNSESTTSFFKSDLEVVR